MRQLEKGCGKSRAREAEGAGSYKERQNTSQALSFSPVPLSQTSQEKLPQPTGSPSLPTVFFFLQTQSPARRVEFEQRMAASMWRMNGLCRSMTGVLLLCALLFSSEVTCEDNSTTSTPSTNTPNAGSGAPPAAPASTAASDPGAAPADGPSGDSAGSTVASTVASTVVATSRHNEQARGAQENSNVPPNSKLDRKNGVPPSSNTSVFVGVLVTGLLAALGMIVGYFKCQRKPDAKGEKLAEEAFSVDQENQGNTLASEAPLNPPPETQEKPSVNGESLEAVKTETSPPTNGHSTAKTADTEL